MIFPLKDRLLSKKTTLVAADENRSRYKRQGACFRWKDNISIKYSFSDALMNVQVNEKGESEL
jgi:hypothetical protein